MTEYCRGLQAAKDIADSMADYKGKHDNAIGEMTAKQISLMIQEMIYVAHLEHEEDDSESI